MPIAVNDKTKDSEQMWKALKAHIIRERQRKKQEREAEVEEERQRKEREATEQQQVMSLGETKEQISQLELKIKQLREEKHELFLQLKKVLNGDDKRRQLVKENKYVDCGCFCVFLILIVILAKCWQYKHYLLLDWFIRNCSCLKQYLGLHRCLRRTLNKVVNVRDRLVHRPMYLYRFTTRLTRINRKLFRMLRTNNRHNHKVRMTSFKNKRSIL